LQTFVEQQFDFLLRKYLGLSVSLNFHSWCIPDPIPESLPQLLHCCTGLGVFLNAAAERGQGFGSGDRSGGLICLVNDTSAAADRKRYVFVPLLERQYLVGRYAIVMGITYTPLLSL
jgi:hypothetical protein